MKMTYLVKNILEFYINQVDNLAKGMKSNHTKPADDVSESCIVLYFSTSSIFPFCDNIIDGLSMDKLLHKIVSATRLFHNNSSSHKSLNEFQSSQIYHLDYKELYECY